MRASCGWLALILPCLLLPGAPQLARPSPPGQTAHGHADPGLVERAREAIARSEYEARPNPRGLQAPNRANGIRTYFQPDGVSVRVRGGLDAPQLLDLSLDGVGRVNGVSRGDRLAKVTPGALTHEGARVEIHRPGLTEWYLNSPAGLEQGFTVEKRPEGDGALVLELRFANATATAIGAGELRFHAANGRSLRFGELHAEDARGRALEARFALPGAERLRLVVADANATYPVTVDPVLGDTPDTSITSAQSGAELGESAAIADFNGDGYADAAVGALAYDAGQANEGAVFVFNGGPSGIASGTVAEADGVLRGTQSFSSFGGSIATGDFNGDGYDDVAVGAASWVPSGTRLGAVFIFPGGPFGVQDGNPGSAETSLVGTAAAPIGFAVACAGDVNGDGYDDLLAPSIGVAPDGLVYVFLGRSAGIASGTTASASATLTGPDSGFGETVAGAGDVNGDGYSDVVIGDPNSGSNAGAAYLFLGSASGIASGTASSAATTLLGTASSLFGSSVSGAGDVNGDGYADLVVGASGYQSGFGGAFVFLGGPSGIANGGISTASSSLLSGVSSARLGISVTAGDLNGDGYSDVVVGTYFYPAPAQGSAYVYVGSPSGVASTTTLGAAFAEVQGTQSADNFASSLATGDLNGDGYDDLLVGAVGFNGPNGTNPTEGAAFVFLGSANGLGTGTSSLAGASIESNQAGAALGDFVVDAGDLNGDGFEDIAVAAPLFDLGQTDEGIVLVFNGSANGLPATLNPANANAVVQGNQTGLNLGTALAAAGDVNGDGYGDLLLGAASLGSGGTALLYLGGPTGIPASASPANASAVLTSDQPGARFGAAVAGIGDVNGDGFADIAVSAPSYDNATNGGAVFVFDGSLAGIGSGSNAAASAKLVGGQPSIEFGSVVAAAGDANGDGYGDLVVGAQDYTDTHTDEGAVLVYHGSANGIASGTLANANTKLEGGQANAFLGDGAIATAGVASAGDFNGDGYDDLVIGDSLLTATPALLFLGGPSGIPSGSAATASGAFSIGSPSFELGSAVAGVGDINGDGFPEVAFGAKNDALGYGAVYVVSGGASPVFLPSATLTSDQSGSGFGSAVAGADVNGDGYADLFVGAPSYSDPQSGEGVLFPFYGNHFGRGRAVRLRQRRTDAASAAVAPLGRSVTPNGFSAEILAGHPDGRGRVAASFEACPKGAAFGASSCSSTTTSYTLVGDGTPSAVLATTFTGLAANTLYHWRARLLYADATGPLPTNPFHSAWRRPGARAALEDIRTGVDTDGDGVPDAADNCPLVSNPGQEDTGGMGPGSAPDRIGDACQCGSVAGDGHVDTTDVAAYRAALANPTGAPLSAAAQTRCRVLGRTGACNIVQVTAIRRAIAAPSLAPIQSGPAAQFCVAARGS